MRNRIAPVLVTALLITAGTAPAVFAAPAAIHGVMPSFDGTPIAYTLFLPETSEPAPVIFYSHGWGGRRASTPDRMVDLLLREGYAVLTWDARGFGDSGGEVNVDSQEYEVKDVRALIDLVARNDAILVDRPGDPRMGMAGLSYAGGIQLMTAAVDDRIDAIAPEIAWNDLPQSLKPGGVLKVGWGSLLYGGGAGAATTEGADSTAGPQTGSYSPMIHQAYAEATALDDWSEETRRWFDARSPKHYLPGTRVPALIAQGVSDTLFPLNEGIANLEQLDGPTKLIVFCGGHTLNPTGTSCEPKNARARMDANIVRWFDRHVRDEDVATGAAIEYQLQDGVFHSTARLPSALRSARGDGRLINTVAPTSGNGTAGTPAPDAIRVALPVKADDVLLGIGKVRIEASLTGEEAALFFKLIDVAPDGERVVVDDQVMAKKIRRSGTYSVHLAGVAWEVLEGHGIELEISPTSADHNSTRTPFIADLEVSASVPVLADEPPTAGGQDDTQVLGTRRRAADRARQGPLPATGVTIPGMAYASLLAALGLVMLMRVKPREQRHVDARDPAGTASPTLDR